MVGGEVMVVCGGAGAGKVKLLSDPTTKGGGGGGGPHTFLLGLGGSLGCGGG